MGVTTLKRHVNVPIFIPHYGCPNACVFCNQVRITGKPCFDEHDVVSEIDAALLTVDTENTETELAFFGGSFTAIPRDEMLPLLAISDRYIADGKITSVRLSTRPDAIDTEILDILAAHGVKTIELGIQSMSGKVLDACKRGHSPTDTENACRLIKQYGFELVGQMMVGLPGATPKDELLTAETVSKLGADGARIYPTVVLPGTELCELEQLGAYTALTVEEAAERCANVLEIFNEYGVNVIRIGLCANEILASEASPTSYHAAIGELARALVFRRKLEALLLKAHSEVPLEGRSAEIFVPKGKLSQAIGQHRSNIFYLCSKFSLRELKLRESADLNGFEISLGAIRQQNVTPPRKENDHNHAFTVS